MSNLDQKWCLSNYSGRILTGDYSHDLKKRVAELVAAFEVFDSTGIPGIPYITAWHHDDNIMWYEFAGHEFIQLFGCRIQDLAGVFRDAVIDHRVFNQAEVKTGIEETVRSQQELSGTRKGLRAEVGETGMVEADYKISLKGNLDPIWLKDRARVENFVDDRIFVSFGFLTDVTNEMVHKDLLEKIGYLDNLTNLPNRTVMHRSLELKIGEFNRHHVDDFTFLLLDIDHFKKVNDTYGHLAGDYVLSGLAQVMTSWKRRTDEIGRYGGEEFYGIALGDIVEGREFAERMRRRVEAAPFVFQGQAIPIQISIGLAAASELQILSENNLIEAADRRLYKAKEQGRNRVVWMDSDK
jgi:diguanylate cyclase (GGDEF)-like protein